MNDPFEGNIRFNRVFRKGRSLVVRARPRFGCGHLLRVRGSVPPHRRLGRRRRRRGPRDSGPSAEVFLSAGAAGDHPPSRRSGALTWRAGVRPFRFSSLVEDALRLGADAVACMGIPGSACELQTLENLSRLAGSCRSWGVPLMAEMIPGGFADTERHTVEDIRSAVRIGVEAGADFVKTKFVGTAETFRAVIRNSYRPVLVLGGARVDDCRDLLGMVCAVLDAGVGVVVGRNVWGIPIPGRWWLCCAVLSTRTPRSTRPWRNCRIARDFRAGH